MSSQSVAFDRAAEYYDETRGFPPGVDQPAAALIAKTGSFDGHSRVLEIGIGTGRIGLPLAAHVGVYCGIDLSPPMMRQLRRKQTNEPVVLAQADATQLPFPDDTFDAAVSVHVFHLIPGWPQALAEVARVLRPGAPLLNCWNERTNDPRILKLWEAWDNAVPPEIQQRVGAQVEDNPDFIQSQGWAEGATLQTHHYTATFSPAVYLDLLKRRVWASHWRLADDDHARGIAAAEAAIPQHFDDASQTIELPARFNVQVFLPPKTTS